MHGLLELFGLNASDELLCVHYLWLEMTAEDIIARSVMWRTLEKRLSFSARMSA
jgi:hypothetical protein